MKTIVTGGAGFIGSHIAERLVNLKHEVTIIDDLSSGKNENIPAGCEFVKADICHPMTYEKHLEGCDVIFHNAASKKNICLKSPFKDLIVNGGGTLKLLQKAYEYGVRKFVHASTGSVYGEVEGVISEDISCKPVSYYGISKLAGENYVRYFSRFIDVTILRYFHVYGERQEDDPELGGVVAIFTKLIREGKPITIHGDGHQMRVFTHVEDVVNANIAVWGDKRATGETYNCCSNYEVCILRLAERLMEKYNTHVEKVFTDPLEGDIYNFLVDNSKIKELGINFRPYA